MLLCELIVHAGYRRPSVVRLPLSYTLRKLPRDDSVISVKLYSTSFYLAFSNYLQKYFTYLKYILIESMFGNNSIDAF